MHDLRGLVAELQLHIKLLSTAHGQLIATHWDIVSAAAPVTQSRHGWLYDDGLPHMLATETSCRVLA